MQSGLDTQAVQENTQKSYESTDIPAYALDHIHVEQIVIIQIFQCFFFHTYSKRPSVRRAVFFNLFAQVFQAGLQVLNESLQLCLFLPLHIDHLLGRAGDKVLV